MEQGRLPMLKTWLSPTQVRIIPVAQRHQARALEVAKELGLRTDIDDREETVGKKIRDAGREWIPYVAVIGDEELNSGQITVTIRQDSTPKSPVKVSMSIEDLRKRIFAETEGKPWKRLPLSQKLSERPKFI
jgi:threonyl-tRNA synthetase